MCSWCRSYIFLAAEWNKYISVWQKSHITKCSLFQRNSKMFNFRLSQGSSTLIFSSIWYIVIIWSHMVCLKLLYLPNAEYIILACIIIVPFVFSCTVFLPSHSHCYCEVNMTLWWKWNLKISQQTTKVLEVNIENHDINAKRPSVTDTIIIPLGKSKWISEQAAVSLIFLHNLPHGRTISTLNWVVAFILAITYLL